MAAERKGKTYEAITYVVLERLRKKGKLKGQVFWNKTPNGMTIEPDLVVGKNIDHPSIIFLLTHSGSAKESEKKLWRNMGELAEAKIFVSTVPRVYNVAFDSVIKENLKKIQESSFDGQLIVGDLKYGKDLQEWVDNNQKDLPQKADDKAEEIENRLAKDNILKNLVIKLEADIQKLIKKTRPELDQLWKMERKRTPGKAPARKETFVRRGLSKLLIFEDLDLALRLYRGKRVVNDEVPGYVFALGLADKSIGRASPTDREIINVVALLTDAQIKSVVAQAPIDRMSSWLLTLRNSPHLVFMGNYVLNNYSNLCDPVEFYKRLIALNSNPEALVDKKKVPDNWPPGTVWLLEFLIEFIKASSGSANGYGYAQLAQEVSAFPGMPRAADRVYTIVLSDWLHRRGMENLPKAVLRNICSAISERLSRLDLREREKIAAELTRIVIRNTLEAKLLTYRGFEPLFCLINKADKNPKRQSIRTCFAESAGLTGQGGKTTVAKSKNTLINWQSCHGSHTNDKKKELSGRAVGLRYSWNPNKKRFLPRPGVEKLILVVDGTWRQKDLDTLVRAGWDEIYYPDEIDLLAKAL